MVYTAHFRPSAPGGPIRTGVKKALTSVAHPLPSAYHRHPQPRDGGRRSRSLTFLTPAPQRPAGPAPRARSPTRPTPSRRPTSSFPLYEDQILSSPWPSLPAPQPPARLCSPGDRRLSCATRPWERGTDNAIWLYRYISLISLSSPHTPPEPARLTRGTHLARNAPQPASLADAHV